MNRNFSWWHVILVKREKGEKESALLEFQLCQFNSMENAYGYAYGGKLPNDESRWVKTYRSFSEQHEMKEMSEIGVTSHMTTLPVNATSS